MVSDCSVQPFTHLVTPKASQKPVGPVIELCAWLRATPQLQGTHPGPESIGPSEPAAFTGFSGSYGHCIFLADPWGGEEKEAASGNSGLLPHQPILSKHARNSQEKPVCVTYDPTTDLKPRQRTPPSPLEGLLMPSATPPQRWAHILPATGARTKAWFSLYHLSPSP